MWISGAITLCVLVISSLEAAPLSSCPKSCICKETELQCTSFKFLPQLPDNQASSITKLVINNSTSTTNPKLTHLHNLRTLNLSSNKIKRLNSLYFPNSLEIVDLSHNFIATLPQDFHSTLSRLKELRLSGNPISCSCDSISIRDQLLQSNVIIPSPVKCHSPENLHGKSWLTVSCVEDLFGEMQGDAPYEGSGSEEVVTESNRQDKSLEEEFIRVDSTTQANLNVNNSTSDDDEEGSGHSETSAPVIDVEDEDKSDYDSEDEPPPVSETPMVRVNDLLLNNVKACNFDCSTPAPTENDTDALPPPSVFEGVKIVFDDFSVLRGTDPPTSSTTAQAAITTPSPETSNGISKKPDAEILLHHSSEKDKDNLTEETQQSSSSTYIFLGALLVLIVALVIYAVVKKRSSARRRSHAIDEKTATANEVELLKATKPMNGTHEPAPIINGRSDKEAPYEDVELRQKPNEAGEEHSNLLVPEAKRVTIKASEIPDSTPKTPILVTRHLNSDGSIVTTPTVHQKV